MPGLLEVLAGCSGRPRYAFMVLNLIAQVADGRGRAGPLVMRGGASMTLRDWLCDALTPMGQRDPRRLALAARIKNDLAASGHLPSDAAEAERLIQSELRERVRASGKTNVSRAVSDLVRAGLLARHYQGYRVDHPNRGAQRQAVYTLTPAARQLVQPAPVAASAPGPRQIALPLG